MAVTKPYALQNHGTIFVLGLLQGPGPAAPMAQTR